MTPRTVISIIFFVTCCNSPVLGQSKSFKQNCTRRDSINHPLIDSFVKQYDWVLAYRAYSSPDHEYLVLARKANRWTCWRYIYSYDQLVKTDSGLKTERVEKPTYWKSKKIIKSGQVKTLLNFLDSSRFWQLNNDSLNKQMQLAAEWDEEEGMEVRRVDKGPTDQVVYQFQVFTKKSCSFIKSYAPDYFVGKYKETGERSVFVKCRDKFFNWWKTYWQ
jgi:hypothetical protein